MEVIIDLTDTIYAKLGYPSLTWERMKSGNYIVSGPKNDVKKLLLDDRVVCQRLMTHKLCNWYYYHNINLISGQVL